MDQLQRSLAVEYLLLIMVKHLNRNNVMHVFYIYINFLRVFHLCLFILTKGCFDRFSLTRFDLLIKPFFVRKPLDILQVMQPQDSCSLSTSQSSPPPSFLSSLGQSDCVLNLKRWTPNNLSAASFIWCTG